MWELQPFSTNRRTTEISLLLGENILLTISQIPHNFVGLPSIHAKDKGHQLVLQMAPNWCLQLLIKVERMASPFPTIVDLGD